MNSRIHPFVRPYRSAGVDGVAVLALGNAARRKPTGRRSPVRWQCELPKPKLPGPLFLNLPGLRNGQVWLHGRAAGRSWEIGPQKTLYLPEPWWKDRNHLANVDEEDRNPRDAFVARDGRVPNSKAVL